MTQLIQEKSHNNSSKQTFSDTDLIVCTQLENFRKKLLDLTARNPLLNFRLKLTRAKTHVRVIDELPDVLFIKLREGKKLAFKALPLLENEPLDEKNNEFQNAYKQASYVEEIYLKECADLVDKEDNPKEMVRIERRLKDRIRVQLGMTPAKNIKPISNEDWARYNNIDPSYELPKPKETIEIGKKDKHNDDWIQTLELPKDLVTKLQGLKRYIHADINETGVNTFYSAFGFLEWYDNESAEKSHFAPLMLLPLDEMKEKKTKDGQIIYTLEASGDELQYNISLAERLKEFNLALPVLEENETPESYMLKVEQLIKDKPTWKVRRFITFGRFQFSRLVMYHDLDSTKWSKHMAIYHNPIIQKLLSGRAGSPEITENREDPSIYDIDGDPQVELAAPILITEADSSQHSAIVDALKGKNLVINGAPGTGKSQTITNLIANALMKGKKVLFIAEKMAALNVVYSRLKQAGLDDFCLELHSTKSKFKEVIDYLATSMANRQNAKSVKLLPEKIERLKNFKNDLRQYSDTLQYQIGQTGKTIHNILWAEQSRRSIIANQPTFIKKIRINNAENFTSTELGFVIEKLKEFEKIVEDNAVYAPNTHPWKGVGATQNKALMISKIEQMAEEALESIKSVIKAQKDFKKKYDWNPGGNIKNLEGFSKLWFQIDDCKSNLSLLDFDLLGNLITQEKIAKIDKLISNLEEYKGYIQQTKTVLKNPETIFKTKEEASSYCQQAKEMGLDKFTAKQIHNYIEKQESAEKLWREFAPYLSLISSKILCKENPDIKEIRLLLEALKLLKNITPELLRWRNETALNESNELIITSIIEKQKNLQISETNLKSVFDFRFLLDELILEEVIDAFSQKNAFSYFKSSHRKALKTYKNIRTSTAKIKYGIANQELKNLKKYRQDLSAFNADSCHKTLAGPFFDGLNTNFSMVQAVNLWARKVRNSFTHSNPENKKIIAFLLAGTIQDVEAVLSQIPAINIEKIQDGLHSIDPNLPFQEYLSNQQTLIKNSTVMLKILEQESVSETIKFDDIAQIIANIFSKMTTLTKEIESNQKIYAPIIGDGYKEIYTKHESLKATNFLAKKLHNLDIPDTSKQKLLNQQILNISTKVCSDLSTIHEKINLSNKKLDEFISIATLDLEEYMGGTDTENISFEDWETSLQNSLSSKVSLTSLIAYNFFIEHSSAHAYGELIKILRENQESYKNIANLFEYLFYRTLCDIALSENSVLDNRSFLSLDQIKAKFQELDKDIIKLQCQHLAHQLYQIQLPTGISSGKVSEYSEMGLIRHHVDGKARPISLRHFIEKAGNALQAIKPCFLMSPLSIAQYISPDSIKFDLVIIDEASQMCPEDALGAIARCRQLVVVGDDKQLPPTTFFQKQLSESNDNYEEQDNDLDNESILDLASLRYSPSRKLLWHYRSRHNSLIAFSNNQFYKNELLVFPSTQIESNHRLGVTSKYVNGIYAASRNIKEAKEVVDAVRQFMRDYPNKSLGVATMNSQQQDLIDNEMDQLFQEDAQAYNYREKWQNTLEPFFVKTLENVQGDERDTIFISTVYGKNSPDQPPMQRFGPINGRFGHRRLNVLFTRAKYNLVLFTSLLPTEIVISETSSLGLKAFKNYLEYAATGKLVMGLNSGRSTESDFEEWVKTRLESKGYEVHSQIGVSGYFIDLTVKHPDYPYGYLLGIECDGAAYHSSKSARDRDRIRQQVLEGLGWSIYRIWSTSWFHDPDTEFRKLTNHIEQLLQTKIFQHKENERKNPDSTLFKNAAGNDMLSIN